jgi:membrane-associated HD superfamily phosphohydrolase
MKISYNSCGVVTVLLMLSVAPFVVVTTFVFIAPEEFVGVGMKELDKLIIMTLFGLITVPVWFTYIPMIILAPLIMKRIRHQQWFLSLPIPALFVFSVTFGALCGIGVLVYPIYMSVLDSMSLALSWAVAGAISGAVTLSVITAFYRWSKLAD